jgi:hypothetical protein
VIDKFEEQKTKWDHMEEWLCEKGTKDRSKSLMVGHEGFRKRKEYGLLFDVCLVDELRYGNSLWKHVLRNRDKKIGKSITEMPKQFRNKRAEKLLAGQKVTNKKKLNVDLINLKTMFRERPLSSYTVVHKNKAKKPWKPLDGFGTYGSRQWLEDHLKHCKDQIQLF